MITKFLTLVKLFLKAKWQFNFPTKKKIIIYDEAGSIFLKNFFYKEDCEIFHNRFEKVNIPILFMSFFNFSKKKNTRKYALEYIKYVNPKLVITYIDNKVNFYELKSIFKNIKFVSIQNGTRGAEIPVTFKSVKKDYLSIDYIFSFDEMHKKLYQNFISGKIIVSGSLKNNFIPIKKKTNNDKKILFISQYRSSSDLKGIDIWGNEMSQEKHLKAERELIPSLVTYCKKNEIRLDIVGCTEDQNEFLFFKSIIKDKNVNWHFYKKKNIQNDMTSYKMIDQATAVVFIDSTLGFEALARMKPIVAFTIRGKNYGNSKYHDFGFPPEKFPDRGPFWTNNLTDGILNEMLDYVMNINENDWKKIYNKYASEISFYDHGNKKFKELMKTFDIPVLENN